MQLENVTMPSYVVNKFGACPYCESRSYDPTKTQERHPGQMLMQCTYPCSKWSVRQRSSQYPLQNPDDSSSSPAVVVYYD